MCAIMCYPSKSKSCRFLMHCCIIVSSIRGMESKKKSVFNGCHERNEKREKVKLMIGATVHGRYHLYCRMLHFRLQYQCIVQ